MSAIGDFLNVLSQTNSSSGNQDTLTTTLGKLAEGGQGNGQAGQVLGALEQMISSGGNQGNVQNMNPAANDPLANLIQPVAEQLSRSTGIQQQTAQTVVSLILHRMLSSHLTIGSGNARLDLNEVFQQMASSGGVNPDVLHNSGMVNDLINSSGMDKQAALKSLSEAFTLLNNHAQKSSSR
jgi:hypothetical protein